MRAYRSAIAWALAGWLLAPSASAETGRDVADVAWVRASSVDGRERYAPENVLDGRADTAWLVPNRGVGEWLELSFADPTAIAEVGLVVGYNKVRDDEYGDRWAANNRLRTVLIEWDGGRQRVTMDDIREMQWVDIGPVVVDRIRIRIESIRPGTRWRDTAIAEVGFRTPETPMAAPTDANDAVEARTTADEPAADARVAPGSFAGGEALDESAGANVRESGRTQQAAPPPPPLRRVTSWVASLGVLGLVAVGASRWRRGASDEQALVVRARRAVRAIRRDTQKLGEAYVPVVAACIDLCETAAQLGEQCAAAQTAIERTQGLSSEGAHARRQRLEARLTSTRSRLVGIVDQLEDVGALVATAPLGRLDASDVDAMIQRLRDEMNFVDGAEEELRCN